ncbi:hypothetical protein BE221DRAFT_146761 [Ostreococcus tauri]|uniref:Ion transport domain-containing protein n=1 Tax=Ostreococcus tauri TaxID=70448 RepID=A0A1Y5I6I6_OSTTA|nr:hypothetical protein BE221DRAFT_146761 [Ostreococcus tauri]
MTLHVHGMRGVNRRPLDVLARRHRAVVIEGYVCTRAQSPIDGVTLDVDGASDGDDPSRVAFERAEWHTQTLAKRSKDLLKSADSSGIWTVGTTALVFVIAGFESLEAEAVTRGVELVAVLPSYVPRDVAPALADGGIERAESCLQAIFLFEYVVRAWSEGFQLRYLRSPVALIDFLSLLPTFGLLLNLVGIGGAGFGATEQFRPLRLFRVLRLLRVLDLSDGGNDELAGDNASIDARRKRREKTQNEKVFAVAVEFLCVFLISGELFYDLEVDTNPNISDVGDAIYWSFLTLTGIGQPFEATTAQGRVATVVSILTALVVVPLQLAVLVSAQTEAQAQVGGGAITGVPPTTRTAIGLGAPVYVPREPPSDDAQLSRMVSDAGSDFWQGTMDEDSAWLRLREREELRDARKKIKSQEITISALRMENKKLRGALEDADLLGTIDIADSFEEDITA